MKRSGVGFLSLTLISVCCYVLLPQRESIPHRGTPTQEERSFKPIQSLLNTSQPRFALVIGNATYPVHTLTNPTNDAVAIANKLRELNFEVTLLRDADKRAMKEAIRAFTTTGMKRGSVGLVYFSGHGVQIAGENYLLPVGEDYSTPSDVEHGAVKADWVLGRMVDAGMDVKIIILDACRNNPFRSWTKDLVQGLAPMKAGGHNAFIAYATSPGHTASDGPENSHSPYTAELLRQIPAPGLPAEHMFQKVRVGVQQRTQNQQIPWESSSLTGVFFFVPLQDPPPPPPPPPLASEKVIFVLHTEISSSWFDPAKTPAHITPYSIIYALHDAVLRPLPGKPIAPALADAWIESADGRTYEFKLRQGLRFHNGDPCTAEDVQYSFQRYKGAGAEELQAKVTQVEVVDPLTIRFHLREPWPDFLLSYGTTVTAAGIVVPKKYHLQVGEEGFQKAPVGLGPYKFVSYTPGKELILEAYEGYWRKVPNIKYLVFKGVGDDTTRLAMLQSGEADMIFALDGQGAEVVQRDPNFALIYTLHPSSFWLEFPEQWDPKSVWADRRVRLAVNYALDRQAINNVACLGFCQPAGVIVPRVKEYAFPTDPIPYDLLKAKQLLAEAGYPNGFDAGDFTPVPPFFMVGEAVANALRAVGIRTNTRKMERPTYLSFWHGKKFRGLFMAASGISGNAATRITTFICSQGAFAYGGYPDIDTLCRQQAVERNRPQREALLHRIQQLTIARVMFAPLIDFRALIGIGPRIAEHAFNTIPSHAFPAWEDVRLKEPNRAEKEDVRLKEPNRAEKGGSGSTPPPPLKAVFVVLPGLVTPQRLQRQVTGYRNLPGIKGFSVQSKEGKSPEQLASAGQFVSRQISVATIEELRQAGKAVGVDFRILAAPGRGFHSIIVTSRMLSDTTARAFANVFRSIPNPLIPNPHLAVDTLRPEGSTVPPQSTSLKIRTDSLPSNERKAQLF